jgi:hypothetical protein
MVTFDLADVVMEYSNHREEKPTPDWFDSLEPIPVAYHYSGPSDGEKPLLLIILIF